MIGSRCDVIKIVVWNYIKETFSVADTQIYKYALKPIDKIKKKKNWNILQFSAISHLIWSLWYTQFLFSTTDPILHWKTIDARQRVLRLSKKYKSECKYKEYAHQSARVYRQMVFKRVVNIKARNGKRKLNCNWIKLRTAFAVYQT